MTRRDYERCRLQGLQARQGGRPAEANPYAGKPALRRQADAWAAGWGEANRDIRRRSNAVFH